MLVTGASGFTGGALCGELLTSGHEVTAQVRRVGSKPPETHRHGSIRGRCSCPLGPFILSRDQAGALLGGAFPPAHRGVSMPSRG